MLIECAWCAICQKDSYLRSKYYKLIPRMGKKKALAAIAHKILKACYYILKNKEEYKDLGASYLEKNNKDKLIGHYIKKLSALGLKAELKPIKKVS